MKQAEARLRSGDQPAILPIGMRISFQNFAQEWRRAVRREGDCRVNRRQQFLRRWHRLPDQDRRCVGFRDHVYVMLDDDDGAALVNEPMKNID